MSRFSTSSHMNVLFVGSKSRYPVLPTNRERAVQCLYRLKVLHHPSLLRQKKNNNKLLTNVHF